MKEGATHSSSIELCTCPQGGLVKLFLSPAGWIWPSPFPSWGALFKAFFSTFFYLGHLLHAHTRWTKNI